MRNKFIILLLLFVTKLGISQVNYVSETITSAVKDLHDIRSIYSEDIDYDGDYDLVSASDRKIGWYENLDGQGTFSDIKILAEGFNNYDNVIIKDMDGDGFKDIIFTSSSFTDKIIWYKNDNGTGIISNENLITETTEFIRSLISFDIDNDGDLDIVAASQLGTDRIISFENLDGLGNFGSEQIVTTNISGTSNIGFADIDNDGLNDLLSASITDGKFAWYKNLGSGNFDVQQIISVSDVGSDNIHPYDIDDDGDLDLLSLSNSGLGWFENLDGQGNFSSNNIISTLPRGGEITTEDTDNDGDKDIIIGDSTSGLVGRLLFFQNLFIETGSAGFGNAESFKNTSSPVTSTRVRDINNDGLIDIFYSSRLDEIAWAENENTPFPNSFFKHKIIKKTMGGFTKTIVLSNIDGVSTGDDYTDLITESDNKVSAYRNINGLGQFGMKIDLVDIGPNAELGSFTSSDLDGDGDNDLALTIEDDNEIKWFRNGSFGEISYIEQQNIPNSLLLPRVILAGNLNDDNINDLLVSSIQNSMISLFINDGNGVFNSEIIIDDFTDQGQVFLDLSDLNGDNQLDIIAFSESDNLVVWFENLGGGQFSNRNIISNDLDVVTKVFTEDINNDGNNDIVVASSFPRKIIWYENLDGLGSFDNEKLISDVFVNQPPNDIYVSDIDNDGLKDVVVASTEANYELGYFRNINFAESFTNFISLSDSSLGNRLINVADINNDNEPDLFTFSFLDYTILWHQNLGVNSNQINGVVRYNNNDDQCNIVDSSVSNLLIQSSDGTNTYSMFTLESGNYAVFPEQGTYTTTIVSQLPSYFSFSPLNQVSNFINYGNASTIDFCIEPLATTDDLNVTIIPPIDEPRPGFDTSYQIIYSNIGTTQLSGDITFQFNDSKIQFLNASETVSSQTTNALTFNYSNLNPFETRTIDLDFNVFPPPTTNIDDELISTLSINPVTGDETQNDNTFELNQTVIGSYDPNDIQILEGEQVHIDDADQYLHFLIRFQNTGTASAINVRVEHILDNKLDWTTMQLQSLSHDGRVEITDGSYVQFIFNNINLPDQTSDEEGSIGYIAFKIKPKDNVVLGDMISGVADIYFDFNPPIITNTATTTFVDNLGNNGFSLNEISVYPNPTDGLLYIKSNLMIHNIEVIDMLGRQLLVEEFNQTNVGIDLLKLDKGVYFVRILSGNKIETKKIIKN